MFKGGRHTRRNDGRQLTWDWRLLCGVAPGQFVTPNGPLTMIDNNEIFNTGYAEGDGGVMYVAELAASRRRAALLCTDRNSAGEEAPREAGSR